MPTGTHSRSPSRSRSRSRSYDSYSSYTDYSDSFNSEDEQSKGGRTAKNKSTTTRTDNLSDTDHQPDQHEHPQPQLGQAGRNNNQDKVKVDAPSSSSLTTDLNVSKFGKQKVDPGDVDELTVYGHKINLEGLGSDLGRWRRETAVKASAEPVLHQEFVNLDRVERVELYLKAASDPTCQTENIGEPITDSGDLQKPANNDKVHPDIKVCEEDPIHRIINRANQYMEGLDGAQFDWSYPNPKGVTTSLCTLDGEADFLVRDFLNQSRSQPIRKPPGKASTMKGKSPPKKAGANKGKGVSKEQDYVVRRVSSARRLKINDLRNENEDLKQQLTDVIKENKVLARTAALQDRKLNQYEDQEGEMPRIIAKHNEELRTAKEQIRRQKEKLAKSDAKLKESQDELDRNKRLLKKMRGLVEDKQLDERDSLARKLSAAEADNEEKTNRVKNLERHVENLQKNHKHELGIERARYRELQKEVQGLKDQTSQLGADLKDARRDLDVQNIYTNRLLKAGRASTINSNMSSPAPSNRNVPHLRKNSDPPGMTPREKAKQFEQQRRQQEKKQRESSHRRRIQQKPYANSVVPASHGEAPTHHNKPYSQPPGTIYENTVTGPTTSSVFMTEDPSPEPSQATSYDRSYVHAPNYNERQSEMMYQSWGLDSSSQRDLHEPGGGAKPGGGRGLRAAKGRGGSSPGQVGKSGFSEGPRRQPVHTGINNRGGRNSFYDSTDRQNRPMQEEPLDTRRTSYQPEPDQDTYRTGPTQTLNDKPANDWWQQMQKQKQHEEKRFEPEEEEEDWRESRERLKLEAEFRARVERERQEAEEQERLDNERRARREKEEQEMRAKQERERKEYERREREERERREREEEAARRAQEERERLANDERERERQRQKNSLLAKMAALEGNKKEDNTYVNDPFAPIQSTKTKPVKKVEEVFDDPFSVPSSRKDTKRSDKVQPSPTRRRGSGGNSYSFGKPIENLHNGKPAYEDVSVPVLERNKRRNNGIFDDEDFSYQPSFGTSHRNSAGKGSTGGSNNDKNKQKNDLMNSLFGGPAATASNNKTDDDDIFGNKAKKSTPNRRNTDNIDFFGSSDPPPKNNSHLLPRRGRQPTSSFTSHAVNAVDNLDDGIEELVL